MCEISPAFGHIWDWFSRIFHAVVSRYFDSRPLEEILFNSQTVNAFLLLGKFCVLLEAVVRRLEGSERNLAWHHHHCQDPDRCDCVRPSYFELSVLAERKSQRFSFAFSTHRTELERTPVCAQRWRPDRCRTTSPCWPTIPTRNGDACRRRPSRAGATST